MAFADRRLPILVLPAILAGPCNLPEMHPGRRGLYGESRSTATQEVFVAALFRTRVQFLVRQAISRLSDYSF